MARKKVAKSKRPEAERAAEHYLYEVFGCLPEQIIRAVRTMYQRQDLWASDVMGRAADGRCYFAQATAGGDEAVRVRRRKLEKICWNEYDNVMLLQLVETINPANARRKLFFFRVHVLNRLSKKWVVEEDAHPVPRAWFKKLRVETSKEPFSGHIGE